MMKSIEKPEIESGIPIPSRGSRSRWIELLNKMNYGDSLVVKRSIYATINEQARKLNVRIVSRTIDKKNDMVRMWKIQWPKENK